MRVGHAQIFVRIDRDVVDAHFIVKMRAGAATAVANVADGVPAMDMLAGEDCEAFQMSVTRGNSVAVLEDDCAPVATHEVGKFHYAFGWRDDRLSVDCANINARVECTFAVEGINTLTEGSCNWPFHGPQVRRRVRADPVRCSYIPGKT